jgi:DNA polymerase III sliding clamp (beta) subunit (PCNA family)
MKIICDAKELAGYLRILKPLVDSKLWIKATAASVKLLCDLSWLTISLKVAHTDVSESGIACLWYRDVARIIGTSSKRKAGNVSISSVDESVMIETDGVAYTLPLMDDELPVIGCKAGQVVKLELREPFKRLKKFMNRDKEYRPALNGIYLDSTHALKAVAANGRILQARSIKGADPPEGFGGIIPYKACIMLMDKAWDGAVAVNQDGQTMWFSKPGMVMSVKLSDHEYVAWQPVITESLMNSISITVNRMQLIDAIKRVNRINGMRLPTGRHGHQYMPYRPVR